MMFDKIDPTHPEVIRRYLLGYFGPKVGGRAEGNDYINSNDCMTRAGVDYARGKVWAAFQRSRNLTPTPAPAETWRTIPRPVCWPYGGVVGEEWRALGVSEFSALTGYVFSLLLGQDLRNHDTWLALNVAVEAPDAAQIQALEAHLLALGQDMPLYVVVSPTGQRAALTQSEAWKQFVRNEWWCAGGPAYTARFRHECLLRMVSNPENPQTNYPFTCMARRDVFGTLLSAGARAAIAFVDARTAAATPHTPTVNDREEAYREGEAQALEAEAKAETFPNLRAAFESFTPGLMEDFTHHVNRRVEQINTELQQGNLEVTRQGRIVVAKNMYGKTTHLPLLVEEWEALLDPVCAVSQGLVHTIPDKVHAAARKYAEDEIARTLNKMLAKTGDFDGSVRVASHESDTISGRTVDISGRKNGHNLSIHQQVVYKRSRNGKPFNQWPARLYVDGKFTPEEDLETALGGGPINRIPVSRPPSRESRVGDAIKALTTDLLAPWITSGGPGKKPFAITTEVMLAALEHAGTAGPDDALFSPWDPDEVVVWGRKEVPYRGTQPQRNATFVGLAAAKLRAALVESGVVVESSRSGYVQVPGEGVFAGPSIKKLWDNAQRYHTEKYQNTWGPSDATWREILLYDGLPGARAKLVAILSCTRQGSDVFTWTWRGRDSVPYQINPRYTRVWFGDPETQQTQWIDIRQGQPTTITVDDDRRDTNALTTLLTESWRLSGTHQKPVWTRIAPQATTSTSEPSTPPEASVRAYMRAKGLATLLIEQASASYLHPIVQMEWAQAQDDKVRNDAILSAVWPKAIHELDQMVVDLTLGTPLFDPDRLIGVLHRMIDRVTSEGLVLTPLQVKGDLTDAALQLTPADKFGVARVLYYKHTNGPHRHETIQQLAARALPSQPKVVQKVVKEVEDRLVSVVQARMALRKIAAETVVQDLGHRLHLTQDEQDRILGHLKGHRSVPPKVGVYHVGDGGTRGGDVAPTPAAIRQALAGGPAEALPRPSPEEIRRTDDYLNEVKLTHPKPKDWGDIGDNLPWASVGGSLSTINLMVKRVPGLPDILPMGKFVSVDALVNVASKEGILYRVRNVPAGRTSAVRRGDRRDQLADMRFWAGYAPLFRWADRVSTSTNMEPAYLWKNEEVVAVVMPQRLAVDTDQCDVRGVVMSRETL